MSNDQDETVHKLKYLTRSSSEFELVPLVNERFNIPIIPNWDYDPERFSACINRNIDDFLKLKLPQHILNVEVLKRLAALQVVKGLEVDKLAKAMELGEPFTDVARNILIYYGLYDRFVPPKPIMIYVKISEIDLLETQITNLEEALVWLQEYAFWKLRYDGVKVQVCADNDESNTTKVTFGNECSFSDGDKLIFEEMVLDAIQKALLSDVRQDVQVLEVDRVGFRLALGIFRSQAEY